MSTTVTYEVSTGARGPAGADAVVTTANVLVALQGAEGDEERIGEEYLPEIIEGKLELADATGTVIEANQVAMVNGHPVVGDGSTLEGTVIGPRIVDYSILVPAATLVSGGVVELASIPVSAERLSNELLSMIEMEGMALFTTAGHSSQLLFHWLLTDYTGYVAPTSLGGGSDKGSISVELGVTSAKQGSYQFSGIIPAQMSITAAVPPFQPNPYYLPRQVLAADGSSPKALWRDFAETPAFDLKGWSNDGSATVGPTSAEDCNLTLFLGIAAYAGNGARTLALDGRIKAWF